MCTYSRVLRHYEGTVHIHADFIVAQKNYYGQHPGPSEAPTLGGLSVSQELNFRPVAFRRPQAGTNTTANLQATSSSDRV